MKPKKIVRSPTISVELTDEERASIVDSYRRYYDHAISLGGSKRAARVMAKNAVQAGHTGIRVTVRE